MSINLIIQPSSTLTSLFNTFALTNPSALTFRVNRAALDNLLNTPTAGDTYTVIVSQAVLDAFRGQNPTLSNTDWVNVKFLATIVDNRTLLGRANAAITSDRFVVKDVNLPPPLPLATKQWKLVLKPKVLSSEADVLTFIAQYNESITHIDLENCLKDQNNVLVDIIRCCNNVEYLKLNGSQLRLNSFAGINRLRKLTHLEIKQCPISPDLRGMDQLISLSFSPPIRVVGELDLSPLTNLEHLSMNGAMRTNITHLKKLKSLEIRCHENSCPADLTIFPDLTTLSISLNETPFPNLNAAKITSLTYCSAKNKKNINFLDTFTNLESLKVQFCHQLEDVSVVTKLSKLKSLSFFCCAALEEIPDLTGLKSLETLTLEEVPSLLPNVNASVQVKSTQRTAPDPWRSYYNAPELKIKDSTKSFSVDITTVTPYKLLHLENLPNLSAFNCYFSTDVKIVYFKQLGTCKNLDLLNIKLTKEITISDAPAVKAIALNATGITLLKLADLPKLERITIKGVPVIASMPLPAFVTREGDETLIFKQVEAVQKNQFFDLVNDQIIRYNTVMEVAERSDWKLFKKIMSQDDFIEYVKIIYQHFKPLVSKITPKKAASLPIESRLYFLPCLSPDDVKSTLASVPVATLVKWRNERLDNESITYILTTCKSMYLDNKQGIPHESMQKIDAIPGRNFMANYRFFPDLVGAYFPLMNSHQLAVTIPMMSNDQFKQLQSGAEKSKAEEYLSHATNEQKALI